MKNILFIFFAAGLIGLALMFFGQGLSVLIPGAFYLIGSILIFNSKEKITEDLATAQLHNNWKITFIFVGNILNTFVWVFFCFIFLFFIVIHEVIFQLLIIKFYISFTIFLIILLFCFFIYILNILFCFYFFYIFLL